MCLGACLQGPAGVGKTEVIKDLAKTLANPLIVYNCSDKINTYTITRFLKGIASSGAWCCLDEFNRTSIDVISIISTHVYTLLKEKA